MHEVWSARLGSLTQLCEGGVSRDHGGRAACACVHATFSAASRTPRSPGQPVSFLGGRGAEMCEIFQASWWQGAWGWDSDASLRSSAHSKADVEGEG